MANLESKKATNTPTNGDSAQYISITDIVCEGPIYGLVDGTRSVYLNDIPSEDAKYARYTPDARSTLTFNGTTGVGTLDDYTFLTPGTLDISTTGANSRKLWLIRYKYAVDREISTVTQSAGKVSVELDGTVLGNGYSTNPDTVVTMVWNGQEVPGRFDGSTNTFEVSNSYDVINSGIAAGQFVEIYTSEAFDISAADLGGTITTTSGKIPDLGTYSFYVGAQYQYSSEQGDTNSPSPLDADYLNVPIQKVDNIYVQQRKGYGVQQPVKDVGNVGGSQTTNGSVSLVTLKQLKMLDPTVASGLGITLFDTDGMPNVPSHDPQDAYPGDPDFSDCNSGLTIMGSEAFGLDTASKIAQCDKVSFSIAYPQLTGVNAEKGEKIEVYAFYDVRLRFKHGTVWDSTTWSDLQQVWNPYLQHKGKRAGPTTFQHIIDLDKFRPFDDFEVRIARVTRHLGLPVGPEGTYIDKADKTKRTMRTESEITQLSSTSEDLFSYPFTALVNTSFSSKQYSTTPRRSYDLKGKLVKVPTSYVSRESSTSGRAEYDDFWGGDFKETLEWSDNPAWIFYDMLTNNRYGAGKYIPETYIDKYALYRISQYCDELVDTGETNNTSTAQLGEWYKILDLGNTNWNTACSTSGITYAVGDYIRYLNAYTGIENTTGKLSRLEPRFRMNLFLTKDQPVYKILKDMASSFTSILYWMDGKLTLVQDAPQDAVYTYSQGNVIDGSFTYETTSAKTKTNQVIVQWNNPDSNYAPDQVIVEDTNSIINTDTVISQNVAAFGCTSESQAIRYGKWKLWTSQNQLEAVSFKTALQGQYLRPGDVINVQDTDRYGISLSGRVNTAGTATVKFDRDITFDSNNSYELYVTHIKPAAFYAGSQDITINSVTYSRGDYLPEAYIRQSDGTFVLEDIDTEEKASQAHESGTDQDYLPLVWKNYTYSKGYGITNPGTTTDQVTITAPNFDSTVYAGTIWGIKDVTYNNVEMAGNLKKYKVLAVSREEKNIYGIQAIEHYNEKFDAIEDRYELSVVPPTVYPLNEPDVIPPPLNVKVYPSGPNSDPYSELTLDWDAPDTTFIASFEIKSNVPGATLLTTSKTQQVYSGLNPSKYTFRVRTVSPQGNASNYVSVNINATPVNPSISYIHGIPKGAYANYRAFIDDDVADSEFFYFEKFPITISSVANPGNPATITQASGNGTVSLANVDIQDTRELYIVLDHSASKVFLAQWDTPFTESGPGFWRDIGDGDAPMDDAWEEAGSSGDRGYMNAGDNKLYGLDSTTILPPGTVLNLSDATSDNLTKGAVVTGSGTDTVSGFYFTLDRTFNTYINGITVYRPTYIPDTTNDAVVSLVREI